MTVLGVAFSFNLLQYYLLPGTAWAHYSSAPLLLHYVTEYNVPGSIATVFILLIPSVWMLCLRSMGRSTRAVPVALPTVLYFSVCTYALLHGINNWTSVRNLSELLVAICIGVIAGFACLDAYYTAFALTAVGTVQAVYTIYYHHFGINDFVSGVVQRAGGTFNQPNGVSAVMLVVLPISLAQALNQERTKLKPLFMLCAPISLSALILTWERGAVLGAVIGACWVLWRKLTSRRTAAVACAALACMAAFVIYYRAAGSQNLLSSSRSINGRFEIWRLSEKLFLRNWLSGVGVGGVSITLPSSISSRGAGQETISQSKNVFMLWLVELGISGGILFVLFAVSIYTTLSSRRSDSSALAYEAAWLALLVGSLFDTLFATSQRPEGNVLWGCLLAGTVLLRCVQQPDQTADFTTVPADRAEVY